MRRALLRNVSLCTNHLLRPSPSLPLPLPPNPKIVPLSLPFHSSFLTSRFGSSSSGKDSSDPKVKKPKSETEPTKDTQKWLGDFKVEDISKEDLLQLVKAFVEEESGKSEGQEGGEEGGAQLTSNVVGLKKDDGDEKLNPFVEAVFRRVYSGEDEEFADQLKDFLYMKFIQEPKQQRSHKEGSSDDEAFDRGMNEAETTDTEIDDLYNVNPISVGKFKEDFLQVDDKKWDDLIKEHTGEGYMESMRQLEEMLEDMQDFDKLLPDEIKKKVEEKFEELGTRIERGELKPDEAYELFSKFEEEIANDHIIKTEAEEGAPQSDETVVPYKTNEPPGEGPILRWTTRVVFSPGSNSWHPKNRKVKLSVTVKELGLTKHQFRRLRSLVGKRYHPGKDELTITSERFEHREENRKDCLRTLLSLIEEAAKAEKLVEDARASYVKERLKANPAFMERLNAKIMRLQGQSTAAALTSA